MRRSGLSTHVPWSSSCFEIDAPVVVSQMHRLPSSAAAATRFPSREPHSAWYHDCPGDDDEHAPTRISFAVLTSWINTSPTSESASKRSPFGDSMISRR
jgi:hypothetical protein